MSLGPFADNPFDFAWHEYYHRPRYDNDDIIELPRGPLVRQCVSCNTSILYANLSWVVNNNPTCQICLWRQRLANITLENRVQFYNHYRNWVYFWHGTILPETMPDIFCTMADILRNGTQSPCKG